MNGVGGAGTLLILTASHQENAYMPTLPDYVCGYSGEGGSGGGREWGREGGGAGVVQEKKFSDFSFPEVGISQLFSD